MTDIKPKRSPRKTDSSIGSGDLKSNSITRNLPAGIRISEVPSNEDLDNPNTRVNQASSIDPDQDFVPSSQRLKSFPKINLPKITTTVSPASGQSLTQEIPKTNPLPSKNTLNLHKDLSEHREKAPVERLALDTLSLSSYLQPQSQLLFAPSDMSAFTGMSIRNQAHPLPSKKMSEQELLLSQIAPSSIDFVRAITLKGTTPTPFQDNLYQIKHDAIRYIYGANRPKKLKKYKEYFDKSKYLCNIVKREAEAIQKYTMPKVEEQEKQNAIRINKSVKLKPMFPANRRDDSDNQEWYEWIDSFERTYSDPNKTAKTLSTRNSSNTLSKINLLKTSLPTLKA